MKAVDTNMVLRALVQDEPKQPAAAQTILEGGAFITSGVWIECEWVLRSGYRWHRERIAQAFASLLDTGTVEVSDLTGLSWAIDRYAAGADWADMIHLVDSSEQRVFVTFERRLAGRAGPATPAAIETLR